MIQSIHNTLAPSTKFEKISKSDFGIDGNSNSENILYIFDILTNFKRQFKLD